MSHRGYTQTKSIRERKHKEAEVRHQEYNKLTLEQKLASAKGMRQQSKLRTAIDQRDHKPKPKAK